MRQLKYRRIVRLMIFITMLFSFRINKPALSADICKMYRQFRINERDLRHQLTLRRSNKQELKVLQLNTATYG